MQLQTAPRQRGVHPDLSDTPFDDYRQFPGHLAFFIPIPRRDHTHFKGNVTAMGLLFVSLAIQVYTGAAIVANWPNPMLNSLILSRRRA